MTEIFRASLIPLIDETTLQESPENIQWGLSVANLLKKNGADDEHVAAVQATATGLRIRPEDVGAASEAEFKDMPIDHQTATLGAEIVMQKLNEICPKK